MMCNQSLDIIEDLRDTFTNLCRVTSCAHRTKASQVCLEAIFHGEGAKSTGRPFTSIGIASHIVYVAIHRF